MNFFYFITDGSKLWSTINLCSCKQIQRVNYIIATDCDLSFKFSRLHDSILSIVIIFMQSHMSPDSGGLAQLVATLVGSTKLLYAGLS